MYRVLEKLYLYDITIILSIVMIILAFITFLCLQFIQATYGRYAPKTKFSLNPKLSWFIQESPSFFFPAYFLINYLFADPQGQGEQMGTNVIGVLLLSMFAIHYFNRFMIYPFKTSSTNRVPIYITMAAFLFCSYNGYLQSKSLLSTPYDVNYVFRLNFICGVLLFFIGMYLNIKSDSILCEARQKNGPGTYIIPRGGLYEYVSCANYFSEIIEWCGFALSCMSLASFSFLLYTISNLTPRAKQHHLWYVKHFKDYPKDRKILIPYIW